MRQRTSFAVVLSLVAFLPLAGCGSSDNSAETSGLSAHADVDQPSITQTKADPHPKVQIRTSMGDVTLELDAEKAPLTVANFLSYVDSGHYDGTIFHHVRRGDVVMGGEYTQQLEKKPAGAAIRNEAVNGLKNERGTIAMARQPNVIDSSTNVFYFNLATNDFLDPKPSASLEQLKAEEYGYCVFGKVVDGLETLDQISEAEVSSDGGGPEFECLPKRTVLIKSARRMR